MAQILVWTTLTHYIRANGNTHIQAQDNPAFGRFRR